jgi:hypothetical protein
MEIEQVETEERIAVKVPNKPGKRVRVIVHDEEKPRVKPPPRKHIAFRFADSNHTGQLRLTPSNIGSMTVQEQYQALQCAATVSVESFYLVLRERGGLSDQLPLRVAWSSSGDRVRILDFDYNSPGYLGENCWPFEWDGTRCALTISPNHCYVLIYGCALEEALACLQSLQSALHAYKSNVRHSEQKELLISVPVAIPLTGCYKWSTLSARNRRSLDTLYLPVETKREMVTSLERFRDSAPLYDEYGITWKYCLMLSGPPGCGKTSSVLALCSHFGWNLSKLTMEPSFTSQNLEQMLQQMPQDNALLLEDVDALFNGREAKTNIDCSTIMNLLDGVATRRGLVIFLTTNYPEKLDGALARDGRVDKHVQLREAGLCEKRQLVERMAAKRWTTVECEALLSLHATDWSMAALQQHMFECIKDERPTLV